jgi:hypothetical protein
MNRYEINTMQDILNRSVQDDIGHIDLNASVFVNENARMSPVLKPSASIKIMMSFECDLDAREIFDQFSARWKLLTNRFETEVVKYE